VKDSNGETNLDITLLEAYFFSWGRVLFAGNISL
jgi:hypothetical protein